MQFRRRKIARCRARGHVHAGEALYQRGIVFVQVGAAVRRDLVQAPRTFHSGGAYVGEFVEQRERGVDGAGTGRIGATELLFDLLDEFVTMARLLPDQ